MRSENEMLDLILTVARADERIRAVVMNGSRANPNAPRDLFQDFDIIYLVRGSSAPFRNNPAWIRQFGELMILQLPEEMGDPPSSGHYDAVYLAQFADGNRIDLSVYPLERWPELKNDSLSVLLLDKDGSIGPLPPPSENSYLPKPPDAKAFGDCCNEFWWVSPYVAKGLWRRELPYARAMLEIYVREQLTKMLRWQIGIQTEFKANPGKEGKYFERYLPKAQWQLLLQTFAGADDDSTWDALEAMGALFRQAALFVAGQYGFDYPHGDDERVSAFLRKIRALPPDAKDIA
ncbi:streptomycin adenylyltransferase [Longilinea arvoryzae]|uniref:Streptomycin adenylyltransferase n=1 Tax=Longilinea arvoryzae TaxID=360412 RepID=A0A0S7BDT0_9CHLR|nr:aminoglycoside 6-adenylyltransferase [Longilinea arvoryzae]GAP13024.1 streptomycin adenylyltransferase [Longilinea arvoryzae]